MSRALFVADIHIKLGQKKVPSEWQRNRVIMLANKLIEMANNYDATTLIIGGDLMDVANPTIDEVGLMYDFLKQTNKLDCILIPGNHEMVTKKKDCYIGIEGMLEDLGVRVVRDFETIDGIDYIPYNIINDKWPTTDSKVAVTHVRGEIPPHVKPEIPLERFAHYDKVFTGDLHSHANSQGNLLYPGSPYFTSFHRTDDSSGNGIFIIDTVDFSHEFVQLNLPQLIRRTVTSAEDMVATDFHHTIYELEGEMDDLAQVENSELLDKKVTTNITTEATLNLSGVVVEELEQYLREVKQVDENKVSNYITEYEEVAGDTD